MNWNASIVAPDKQAAAERIGAIDFAPYEVKRALAAMVRALELPEGEGVVVQAAGSADRRAAVGTFRISRVRVAKGRAP